MSVYFIRPIGMDGPIKIGHSMNPIGRMRQIQPTSPFPLEICKVIDGNRGAEMVLHQRFAHLRMHGEWFRAGADLLALIGSQDDSVIDAAAVSPLRRWREENQVSIDVAAERIGMTKSQLSRIERGLGRIPHTSVAVIADWTGIPRQELRPDLAAIFLEPASDHRKGDAA